MAWTDARTTEQKGLGHAHRRERAEALRQLVPGTPCPRCLEPMLVDQALDYDHVIPRADGGTYGPKRLAHRSCNRRAGGQLGNQRMRENAAADGLVEYGTYREIDGRLHVRTDKGWSPASRRW